MNKFFTEESQDDNRYLAIPSKENPRIILPLRHKALYKTGLSIHNTAALKNRILKRMISYSFSVMKRNNRNLLYRTLELTNLLSYLNDIKLTTRIEDIAVYYGTKDSINRKITFFVNG